MENNSTKIRVISLKRFTKSYKLICAKKKKTWERKRKKRLKINTKDNKKKKNKTKIRDKLKTARDIWKVKKRANANESLKER